MADKNSVAVLDFGSGKVLGLAAEASGADNSGVLLQARVESLYNGFYQGEWTDKQSAKEAIVKTLKQMENAVGSISKIYIGVPGEFSVTAIRDAEVRFNSPHKINTKDINGLFDAADNFSTMPNFKAICASPTYFVLDDGKRVTAPYGKTASNVYAAVSFCFAEKKFCSFVEGIVKKFGVVSVEFIPGCLAQALYVFNESEREETCLLVDVGFTTSSVSLAVGDGLLFSKSFSVGAGHFSDDLSQVLEIEYEAAEELRRKINLNLEFGDEDTYSVGGKSFNAIRVNEIVVARIEDISEKISACILESGFELSPSATAYLSGGGLSFLKGGVNCLSRCLGMRVRLAPIVSPELDRRDYTSGYGLLCEALRQSRKPKGFFDRLLAFVRIK